MGDSMMLFFRRRPRYVVVWWPSPLYDVPEVIGPFTSRNAGLAARDAIRAEQQRWQKMAQLVPVEPPAPARPTPARVARPSVRLAMA